MTIAEGVSKKYGKTCTDCGKDNAFGALNDFIILQKNADIGVKQASRFVNSRKGEFMLLRKRGKRKCMCKV